MSRPNATDLLAERLDLSRLALGLRRTGLLFEIRKADAFVVLAPTDDAFDALPCTFAELIHSPELLEARFALFEGLVSLHTCFHAVGCRVRCVSGDEVVLDDTAVRGERETTIAAVHPVRRGHFLRLDALPFTLDDHLFDGRRATA